MAHETITRGDFRSLHIADADRDQAKVTIYPSGRAYVVAAKSVRLTPADARALIDHLEPVAAPKPATWEVQTYDTSSWPVHQVGPDGSLLAARVLDGGDGYLVGVFVRNGRTGAEAGVELDAEDVAALRAVLDKAAPRPEVVEVQITPKRYPLQEALLRALCSKPAEPAPGDLVQVVDDYGTPGGIWEQIQAETGINFLSAAEQHEGPRVGFAFLSQEVVDALGEFRPLPAADDLVQYSTAGREFDAANRTFQAEGYDFASDATDYAMTDAVTGPVDLGVRFLSADAVEALGEFRPVTLPDPDLYAAGDQVWAKRRPYFTLTVGRLTVIERSSLVTDAEAYLVEDKHGNRQHVYARDLHRGGPSACPTCTRKDAA